MLGSGTPHGQAGFHCRPGVCGRTGALPRAPGSRGKKGQWQGCSREHLLMQNASWAPGNRQFQAAAPEVLQLHIDTTSRRGGGGLGESKGVQGRGSTGRLSGGGDA